MVEFSEFFRIKINDRTLNSSFDPIGEVCIYLHTSKIRMSPFNVVSCNSVLSVRPMPIHSNISPVYFQNRSGIITGTPQDLIYVLPGVML